MTFRAAQRSCPACGAALEASGRFERCTACAGVWIADAALTAMVQTMTDGRELGLALTPLPGGPDRPCPACHAKMSHVGLEQVALERCAGGHGLWLDSDELQRVLERAGARPARPSAGAPDHALTPQYGALSDSFDDRARRSDDAGARGFWGLLASLFR